MRKGMLRRNRTGRNSQTYQTPVSVRAESQVLVKLWRTVDENTIEVNLDAAPKRPFDRVKVGWTTPGLTGWVQVKRLGDDILVGGRRLDHHYLSKGQKKDDLNFLGHNLRKQLENKAVVHPNVFDSLAENVHLIPDSWKKMVGGRTRYICSWAVGFRSPGGFLYVRCFYWGDGALGSHCYDLGRTWGDRLPTAILERAV